MSTNISKQKRDELLNKIKEIRTFIASSPQDENTGNLLSYISDLEKDVNGKKYGLVFEEHREEIDEVLDSHTPVLTEEKDLFIDNGGQMNFLIDRQASNAGTIKALLDEIYAVEQSEDKDYELISLGLISKLWSETLQYIKNHPDILLAYGSEQRHEQKTKDAVSFIHEHFAENICISDITRKTFVSRSELFRSFQRYMNQTPIEYLLEYRLAQAANLLMKTDKSVTQIATDCGFSGASYFGKAFKNKYGISPLKFRNSL